MQWVWASAPRFTTLWWPRAHQDSTHNVDNKFYCHQKHKSGGICMGIHYIHLHLTRSNDNNGIVIVGTPYYIHLILLVRVESARPPLSLSLCLRFILVRAACLYWLYTLTQAGERTHSPPFLQPPKRTALTIIYPLGGCMKRAGRHLRTRI